MAQMGFGTWPQAQSQDILLQQQLQQQLLLQQQQQQQQLQQQQLQQQQLQQQQLQQQQLQQQQLQQQQLQLQQQQLLQQQMIQQPMLQQPQLGMHQNQWSGGQQQANFQSPGFQQFGQSQQFQVPPPPPARPPSMMPGHIQAGGVAAGSRYIVATKGNDEQEVVMRTLLGEYVEVGENHGRKYYHKFVQNPGPDHVDVFLYFWDNRDGPSFEGWWFGNKVGGTQVWSQSQDTGLLPPSAGWKIPWDGTVRTTLIVAPKDEYQRQEAELRLRSLQGDVAKVDIAAKSAVSQAQAVAGNLSLLGSIQQAEAILTPHSNAIVEVLRKLTEAQRSATGEVAGNLLRLGNQLRQTQTSVNQELNKFRSARTQAEQKVRAVEAEQRDNKTLEEMMPEVAQKTEASEQAVEKAVKASLGIAEAGDNYDKAKRAVELTHTAVQAADSLLNQTRVLVSAKQIAAKKFESAKIKEQALADLGKMNVKLQNAQNKLVPLRNVQKDFSEKQTVQKVINELIEKIKPAEQSCEQAEKAAQSTANEDEKEALEELLHKASTEIEAVVASINQKKYGASQTLLTQLKTLEDRVKTAENKVLKIKQSQKEASEREALERLLKDGPEKLKSVEEKVAKAKDAETPFLTGLKDLPEDKATSATKACEDQIRSANTAISIARLYFKQKQVEVKGYAASFGNDAQIKLKDFLTKVEASAKVVEDLKANMQNRKDAAQNREAAEMVKQAEELGATVAKVAAVFADDAKLLTLSDAEIIEASNKTGDAEADASTSIMDARSLLSRRQQDVKAKDPNGVSESHKELAALYARITTLTSEVSKHKRNADTAMARIKAMRDVEDATQKLVAAEEQSTKMTELLKLLEDESSAEVTSEKIKEVEEGITTFQAHWRTAARAIDIVARHSTDTAKENAAKMDQRLKAVHLQLDASRNILRMRADKVSAKEAVAECKEKVEEAEAFVKVSSEAEEVFLKITSPDETEEKKADDTASQALATFEAAIKAASSAVNQTKSLLGTKRINVKRSSPDIVTSTTDALDALQKRLEVAGDRLIESKKIMATKHYEVLKKDLTAKLKSLEDLIEAAKVSVAATLDDGTTSRIDAAGASLTVAQSAAEELRKLLTNRQYEARQTPREQTPAILSEISAFIKRVDDFEADLKPLRNQLHDEVDKASAKNLLKESIDLVEDLEKRIASASTAASTEVFGDLPAKIYLSNVVEALRQSLNRTNEKPEALIAKFSGQKVTEEQFIAFCLELPELLVDGKIPLYSSDELKAAFKSLAASEIQENGRTSETSEVSKQCLLNQFQTRYTCSAAVAMTDKLAVRGCKTIRKLQVGEVLDGLEDAVKDERSGLLRLKARTEDGVEGFVTLTGNVTGTNFLAPFLPHTALLQRVETSLQQMTEALKDCAKELDTKMQATSSARNSTPLADAKAEISKLRPRIASVQSTLTGLRKNLSNARQTISDTEDSEKRRREEALDRGVAVSLTEAAQKEVSDVFTQLDKVLPIAEKFAELRSSTSEESADNVSIEGLLESEKDLSAAVEALSGLKIKISNWQGQCTSYSGPFGEAWKALSNLEGQVKENDERCQKNLSTIQSLHKQLAIASRNSLVSALRALVHSKEEDSPSSAEALFEKLSNGNPTISLEDLKNLIGSKFKAGELELALERSAISHFGWSKFGFLASVQDFMKCVKEVAVTEEFDVKIGKQVKKLAIGDIVEVLDATKLDEATNLPRVRCRTLVDLQEGWVSLKTSQGSNLLERCAKPFYTVHDDMPMHDFLESSSAEVGRLNPGQVIEVLEGPKREAPTECMRVRGACSKDGKTGWLTLKEGDASDCLESVKVLVCRSNTVLTTELDVGAGKTIRKVEIGELMEALDEPKVDEQRSLTRTKVKLRKDDKEGWVTFIGNQGVNYVVESDAHHLCKRRVALENGFKSGSSVLRYVEEGEILEVLEGPKSEKKDGQQRLRGRTHRPPQEGWVTFNRSLTLWSPKYRCLRSIDITEKLDVTSAVVRRLTPSELVEALDLPQVDESTGQVRVQVRVEKDNKLGFVTVRSLEGTVFLEALAPSDRERIGRGSHPPSH